MSNDLHDRIRTAIRADHVAYRDTPTLETCLRSLDGADVDTIGASRNGQAIFGVRVGKGPRRVSVIAGCHADEPVGPMTAQALPAILRESFPELLDSHTFHIVPQMNPDGADRNRIWFSDPPDLDRYLDAVVREQPGDDIEFGFGDADRTRPENRAAMTFLTGAAPVAAHFSLHGMAFAEGAWCLINREWRDRARAFMDAFVAWRRTAGLPLHDVDRHGEKGFERIREGFCTTPRSDAMRAYFLERDDPDTAAKFQPNSMEFMMGLGGDPLCIVSELPMFLIGTRSPDLDRPISDSLKIALQRCRAAGGEERAMRLARIVRDFDLRPMPLADQMRAQLAMILLATRFRKA